MRCAATGTKPVRSRNLSLVGHITLAAVLFGANPSGHPSAAPDPAVHSSARHKGLLGSGIALGVAGMATTAAAFAYRASLSRWGWDAGSDPSPRHIEAFNQRRTRSGLFIFSGLAAGAGSILLLAGAGNARTESLPRRKLGKALFWTGVGFAGASIVAQGVRLRCLQDDISRGNTPCYTTADRVTAGLAPVAILGMGAGAYLHRSSLARETSSVLIYPFGGRHRFGVGLAASF